MSQRSGDPQALGCQRHWPSDLREAARSQCAQTAAELAAAWPAGVQVVDAIRVPMLERRRGFTQVGMITGQLRMRMGEQFGIRCGPD